jgi:Undecaprenyl-phosphate galactose phosphotransferase WbaP
MKFRSLWIILLLVLGDVLSLAAAFTLSTALRGLLIPWLGGVVRWHVFWPMLQLNLICVLLAYALNGLYPGFGRTAVEEMRQVFQSLTVGYGVLGLALYLQQVGPDFPRSVFLVGWGLAFFFNLLMRFAIRNRASLLRWWGTPVVLVGHGEGLRDVIIRLRNARRMGLRPALVWDTSAAQGSAVLMGIPVVGAAAEVEKRLAAEKISYAMLLEPPNQPRAAIQERLRWLSERFPTVLVVLADSPLGSLWVRTVDLEGRLAIQTQYNLLDRRATWAKRVFDLALGSLALGIILPMGVLIALAIRLDSPGPVFYVSQRLGRNGRLFRYLKFRTMYPDAEQRLAELMAADEPLRREYETFHKLARDPRVTRLGRFLRKFSLDELPQLWHILTGEMSLVGPRAYLPGEQAQMGEHGELILRVQPGLTGWWQVMGRHETTFQHRLELDEYYLSNWSLWLDVYIVFKTVWVLVSGRGA